MNPYYDDGQVTIYHGDSREVLPALPQHFPTIITDPPYGVGMKYGEGFNDSRKDYWDWMRETLRLLRIKADTVAFTHRIPALRELTGWDWMGVWNKPLAMSGLNHYPVMPHWEPIFLYGIGGRDDLKRRYDVVSVNPENARKWGHPAPKPIALYSYLVDWLVPKDRPLMCDPFCGTGASLAAAKGLGVKAIGIEVEERFCEIAANRVAQGVMAV